MLIACVTGLQNAACTRTVTANNETYIIAPLSTRS